MESVLGGFAIIVRPSRGKGKVTVKRSYSSRKAGGGNREQHQYKLITKANQVQATMLQPLLSVYCYIIQASTGQYYTGITNNITKRLKQHNAGATKSTQKLKGWYVVHLQILPTRKQARAIEIKIKARGAKRYIYSYNKQQKAEPNHTSLTPIPLKPTTTKTTTQPKPNQTTTQQHNPTSTKPPKSQSNSSKTKPKQQ